MLSGRRVAAGTSTVPGRAPSCGLERGCSREHEWGGKVDVRVVIGQVGGGEAVGAIGSPGIGL